MRVPATPPIISRRRFFLKGVLGGTLLLIGAALPAALRRGPRRAYSRGRPLAVLSAEEHAILAALAARLVPGDGAAGWPSAEQLDCAGQVDTALTTAHPADARDFRRLLCLLDNGLFGLFTTHVPVCFTRLSLEEQDRRLDSWSRSRLLIVRSGFFAVKHLVHATYYASPAVFAWVGYPGPPVVPDMASSGPRVAPP